MGQQTNIEWTDHTFSPWRGCTKVSAGCKHCYAETLSKRNPAVLGAWGPRGVRRVAAESYWREPIKWNANARTAGVRRRVFCASLADVFEGADMMPAESWPLVQAARLRLLRLIHDTPHLDWLLLTKRPENIVPALQQAASLANVAFHELLGHQGDAAENEAKAMGCLAQWLYEWAASQEAPPANVWLGTSVENQEQADIRIPHLLAAPAAVRFLSCEPLLGPVDARQWLHESICKDWGRCGYCDPHLDEPVEERIDWVIVGGESGPKARPMHPSWALGLRDQCTTVGVPFLFKQWGEWAPCPDEQWHGMGSDQRPHQCAFSPGGVSVGGFLGEAYAQKMLQKGYRPMQKIGKVTAGRLLDGQEYSEFPNPAQL